MKKMVDGLSAEFPELTAKQRRAIELYATVPGIEEQEVARQIGVTRQTLWQWRKRPAFEAALRSLVRTLVPTTVHRKLIDAMVKKAERGDSKMMGLYLRWRGEVDPLKIELNVEQETPVVTFVYSGRKIDDGEDLKLATVRRILRLAGDDPGKALQMIADAVGGEPPAIEAEAVKALPAVADASIRETSSTGYSPPDVSAYLPVAEPAGLKSARIRGQDLWQKPGETDRAWSARLALARAGVRNVE